MIEHIEYYLHRDSPVIAIKIFRGDANLCPRLSQTLFRIAYGECPQPGLEAKPFTANWVYEFANGLVFRLFDPCLDESDKVLEFYVPPSVENHLWQVFSRIPVLLQQAGVADAALVSLRQFLQDQADTGIW